MGSPLYPGALLWVPPHTRGNESEYRHFFAVMFATNDDVLWTSLSSVKKNGLRYDNTCELDLPRGFLRHTKQERRHYVRYDRARMSTQRLATKMELVGTLTNTQTKQIVAGLYKSPETAPDMLKIAIQMSKVVYPQK